MAGKGARSSWPRRFHDEETGTEACCSWPPFSLIYTVRIPGKGWPYPQLSVWFPLPLRHTRSPVSGHSRVCQIDINHHIKYVWRRSHGEYLLPSLHSTEILELTGHRTFTQRSEPGPMSFQDMLILPLCQGPAEVLGGWEGMGKSNL